MNYYIEVLKKYTVFEGRARRKEYWIFVLFQSIIGFVAGFIGGKGSLILSGGETVIGWFYVLVVGGYTLGTLLPSLAVGVRRLHDTGRSGWWYLISFVPFIGGLVLIVFFLQDSQPGANKYGPNPKGVDAPAIPIPPSAPAM